MCRYFLIALCASSVLLSAEAGAGERLFGFAPSEAQRSEYINGQQVLMIDGASAAIAIAFIPSDKKRGWIALTVQNLSTDDFLVQETSLSAASGRKTLTVYTYDMLAKEQKSREFWSKFGTALRGTSNVLNAEYAGTTRTTGTYTGQTTANIYGSGGYASGTANTTGSYSETTEDARAVEMARANANTQNDQMIDRMRATHDQARATLANRVLRANTVGPGEMVSGQVMIELPKKSAADEPFEITLRVGVDQFKVTLIEN